MCLDQLLYYLRQKVIDALSLQTGNRDDELRWLDPLLCLWAKHFAARSQPSLPLHLLHLERSVSIYVLALTDIKPVWHVQINSIANKLEADKSRSPNAVWLSGWLNTFWQAERDQSTHVVINEDRKPLIGLL